MKIVKNVDWISVTFPDETKADDVFPFLDWKYQGEGRHGYTRMERDPLTGATYQSNGRAEMGAHLTLPGGALSELRQGWSMTDGELLAYFARKQGKTSRLDLAINFHGAMLSPESMIREYRAGAIQSTARSWLYVYGGQDGIDAMTFYLGNRQSERFLRAYDKNAEQKIVDPIAWTRLELELKGLRAKAAHNACGDHPVEAVINAQFDDFLTWSNREYQTAIRGPTAPINELGRPVSNTERWLLTSVAKSLAKQSHLDPAFRLKFNDTVDGEIDILRAKEQNA